jgi:hypothetical protein
MKRSHGSGLKAQGSAVEVGDEAVGTLPQHAQIPIAFTVERVIDIEDGPGGFVLTERVLEGAYVKDYDAHEPPPQWAKRCDLSTWGLGEIPQRAVFRIRMIE